MVVGVVVGRRGGGGSSARVMRSRGTRSDHFAHPHQSFAVLLLSRRMDEGLVGSFRRVSGRPTTRLLLLMLLLLLLLGVMVRMTGG